MFTKDQEEKIKDLLTNKSKTVIVVHRNPDGDALGSSLGLKKYLKKSFDFDALVLVPDPFPSFLDWMPGAIDILIAKQHGEIAAKVLRDAELLFCLDFNHPSRT
ncbi:MAG: DHH family phosphoesterase, partial [Bacteroidia bacterium]